VKKRLFDIIVASLGLLVLALPIIFLAVSIRFALGQPIFFRQVRPGRFGQPFDLIKFRTMTDARDAAGALKPDADRLTPFGRWLRASSLDEIPELFNILRGDMSLVGPRPLLMSYLPLYSQEQARRHAVRPGLTGWAQVNGRNSLTWERKFELDVWYVDNQSIALDVKILFITIVKVLRRDGISAPGDATMPAFNGNSGSET
jgi:lipopolysaccharide/colanic/teichoic acid biosynthesis glycosyltransferase